MELVLNTYLTLLELSRHCASLSFVFVVSIMSFFLSYLTYSLPLFSSFLSRVSVFFRRETEREGEKRHTLQGFQKNTLNYFSMPELLRKYWFRFDLFKLQQQYGSTRKSDQSTVAYSNCSPPPDFIGPRERKRKQNSDLPGARDDWAYLLDLSDTHAVFTGFLINRRPWECRLLPFRWLRKLDVKGIYLGSASFTDCCNSEHVVWEHCLLIGLTNKPRLDGWPKY